MCGFVGEVSAEPGRLVGPATLDALTDALARRGPDGRGTWRDEHCALGFRRLAVIDPTAASDQPMATPDGRHVLAFNGELYDFGHLRSVLEGRGRTFRTRGDTEVVLAALAEWGRDALDRFDGMFALAWWDAAEHRLLLARDHAGIKPLYGADTRHGAVFASQYELVLGHPDGAARGADPERVAQYLRLGWISAPGALVEGTWSVEPGGWVEVGPDGGRRAGRWFTFAPPPPEERLGPGPEADEAVAAVVAEAVARQSVSDVAWGAFLSGGVDSPLVAAHARRHVGSLDAFTVGHPVAADDETPAARRYAAALGLDHHVSLLDEGDSERWVDEALAAAGEPVSDPSIIPALAVAEAARERVTVLLAGDGGDELFWGYTGRMGSIRTMAPAYRAPKPVRDVRRLVRNRTGRASPFTDNLRWASLAGYAYEKQARLGSWAVQRLLPDAPAMPDPEGHFADAPTDPDALADWLRRVEWDAHLPRVLLKLDRATMHHSVEARVPLLGRRVVDLALRLRWDACVDPAWTTGKQPLRRALGAEVGEVEQAKRGFEAPLGPWMAGALGDRTVDAFAGRTELCGLPVADPTLAADLVARHRTGDDGDWSWSWPAWTLLVLADWDDRWAARRSPASGWWD